MNVEQEISRQPSASAIRSRILFLGKLVVAGAVIFWLIHSGHLNLSSVMLAKQNPEWLAVAFALISITVVAAAGRWHYLLACQGIALTMGETLRLSLMGMFFSTILPGGISGDAVKIFYISAKVPDRKIATTFTILMDRVLGLASLMVFACAAILMRWQEFRSNPQLLSATGVLGLIVMGVTALFLLALSDRVRFHSITQNLLERLPFTNQLNYLYDAVYEIKRHRLVFFKALVFSFTVAVASALTFYALGRALGNVQLGFSDYSLVVPLIFIAVIIPIAPAGIGVGQAAALLFFSWVGVRDNGFGAALMTLFQVGTIFYSLVGAIVFLTHKRELAKAIAQSKEEAQLHVV